MKKRRNKKQVNRPEEEMINNISPAGTQEKQAGEPIEQPGEVVLAESQGDEAVSREEVEEAITEETEAVSGETMIEEAEAVSVESSDGAVRIDELLDNAAAKYLQVDVSSIRGNQDEMGVSEQEDKAELTAAKMSEGNDDESEQDEIIETKRADMTTDFTEFIRDFFGRIAKWFKVNQRITLTALAVCMGVVLVIWIAVVVSGKIDAARLAASVSGNTQISLTENNGVIPVPQEALQENAYPAVNELVNRYFEALQNNDIETLSTLKNYVDAVETAKVNVKYRYVESYSNIVCYTKVGPIQNSYLVYVCYDVKMRDWDVIAPSLLTLFVCTSPDEGELYIYTGDFDENVANYIAAISSQEDVVDLINRVDTEYHEIMDANADFAAYMSALNSIIRDEVSQQLADAGYLQEETVSAEEVPEVQEPEETVSDNSVEEEPTTFEVQAVTTVNVRASDSEQADRLGKVSSGTVMTCNGHQANGWSEVVYEGQIGYIKTEYLLTLGEGADETQANGSVTVSETVNVRGTADVDGEKLGVAYAGESFPLIGNTNGEWTHIIYNGRDGFIKSEFVMD
ncbi:MAG: SH3 domain-containing protein [Lachnospiraceae bacterium]